MFVQNFETQPNLDLRMECDCRTKKAEEVKGLWLSNSNIFNENDIERDSLTFCDR